MFLLFLLIPNLCPAQNTFTTGIRVGLSFTDWYGKGAEEFTDNFNYLMTEAGFTNFNLVKKNKFGFLFGASFNYRITDYFFLQPEVIFSMKGVKFDGSGYLEGYNVSTTITIKTNYIEIPLLAKLMITKDNASGLFIFLGPAFALNTSSNMEVNVKVLGESSSDESKFENIKDTDFCAVLGGGFIISNEIVLEARYNLGLFSINDSNDGLQIKNRGFSLICGFRF